MAGSTSFDQSKQAQSSQSAISHPSRATRGKNPKKSLVHANVFSLRDLLTEFGKAFSNMNHLDAYNYPYKYKQHRVYMIASMFGIHPPYKALAPKSSDRACFQKAGCIRLFKETFYVGFRLTPPYFVSKTPGGGSGLPHPASTQHLEIYLLLFSLV